jgi:hypothetical protein
MRIKNRRTQNETFPPIAINPCKGYSGLVKPGKGYFDRGEGGSPKIGRACAAAQP